MLLDTSLYGGFTALKKGAKVLAWVAVSGSVAALIGYLNGLQVDANDIIKLGALALINSGLVSLKDWLTSVRPFGTTEQAPTVGELA